MALKGTCRFVAVFKFYNLSSFGASFTIRERPAPLAFLVPKLCLGMPMTKLRLVWLIRQAVLEGRHSQAEFGNETTTK